MERAWQAMETIAALVAKEQAYQLSYQIVDIIPEREDLMHSPVCVGVDSMLLLPSVLGKKRPTPNGNASPLVEKEVDKNFIRDSIYNWMYKVRGTFHSFESQKGLIKA